MRGGEERDDAGLLGAAGADVSAFEALYRRHIRRVTAFAASRCATPEDVADVVAQTFVRLLDAADRYDPDRGEVGPFLLGIAANVARDLERKRWRQRRLVDRLAGRGFLDEDDVAAIEAAIDAARAAPALDDAVEAVPPGEQAVLLLVAGGRTPAEAAAELGISPGAARTRLARARARVRSRLDPNQEEHP